MPSADVAKSTLILEFSFFIPDNISFFMRLVWGGGHEIEQTVLQRVLKFLQHTACLPIFFQMIHKHIHSFSGLGRQLSLGSFLFELLVHGQWVQGFDHNLHSHGDYSDTLSYSGICLPGWGFVQQFYTHFLKVAFALNPSINEVVLLPLEPLWVHWEKRPSTLIDL